MATLNLRLHRFHGECNDTLHLGRPRRHSFTYLLTSPNSADLPVEQASKFQLVVNLKAARALGLTIPQAILLRANEALR